MKREPERRRSHTVQTKVSLKGLEDGIFAFSLEKFS